MEFRNLGRSGLRVSFIGLGCNNFGGRLDLEASRKVVHQALDSGITFFDTADMYGNRGGSERALGEILGPRRKDIVLATKFGLAMDEAGELKGASRRYIFSAVEASLKRLKTDYLDLYQLHHDDPLTPIAETLGALNDLIRQGKIRHIGCSNLPAWKVVDADWTARQNNLAGFVSCQDEYSILVRGIEKDLLPAMHFKGLGLLPYYPLANGMLTGKYRRETKPTSGRLSLQTKFTPRYLNDENFNVVEKLEAFAAAQGRSVLDLAFSWFASRAEVSSVIAGASTPAQVVQNVAAASRRLTPEQIAEIDTLSSR